MLRPHEGLLVMSVLNFSNQVSGTSAFDEEIPNGDIDPKELQLAMTEIGFALFELGAGILVAAHSEGVIK
jgi:non-homologous end joining protein Ku